MNAFEFMGKHPILTFLLACILADLVCKIWRRLIRHLNIRRHGWPPVHLDADGDFKPAPKEGDQ